MDEKMGGDRLEIEEKESERLRWTEIQKKVR